MKILSRLRKLEVGGEKQIFFGLGCDDAGLYICVPFPPINRKLTKKEEQRKADWEGMARAFNDTAPSRELPTD